MQREGSVLRGTRAACRAAGWLTFLLVSACSGGVDLSGKSVDEMVGVLRSGTAADRLSAVEALGTVGLGGGQGIFEALCDIDPEVRGAAARAAGALGASGQGLAASSAVNADARIRAGAMLALHATGTSLTTAEPILRKAFTDDYPIVRASAADGVRAYGGKARAFAAALQHLSRADVKEVQVAAARALWVVSSSAESALPPLMRGLTAEAVNVRLRAIEGLVSMRGEAFDANKKLMTVASTDVDGRVREAAGKALKAVKR